MISSESLVSNSWPLLLYFIGVVLMTSLMMGLSYFLGERHKDNSTNDPYESGIASLGSARLRLSAKFYLVALFFVIFDLEVIFLFAWAISLYELGWTGYFEALIFTLVLFSALLYLWRRGALDWSSEKSRRVPSHAR